ncbi:MAG: branched-chain amino acid ABC transporter permease [Deltaproteobacteria bacterium]|nr:branched-chain amino acid ABC transporter permease [Deltaproteobacteria bacterium]MBW2068007.1 branched-chain amino acid ABC transporter permease [Deltaproteobacteria bacterium]
MSAAWIGAIFSGVLLGLLYGLAAIGLNLIWGVMNVINLSHGAFIALGMFSSYFIAKYIHISPFIGVFLVLVVGVGIGALTYFVALHRVLSAPELSTLLATYSVSLVIIGLGTFFFTTNPRAIDIAMGSVSIAGTVLPTTRILTGVFSVVFTAALYLFLYKTWHGKAIRAVSMNRAAAELMGVNTTLTIAVAFGVGVALAMSAGALVATIFPFTILSGGGYELKSFVICVLGGLGSPLGALIGGLILGLIENIVTLKIPTSYVPFLEFVILVFILIVKPTGILAKR